MRRTWSELKEAIEDHLRNEGPLSFWYVLKRFPNINTSGALESLVASGVVEKTPDGYDVVGLTAWQKLKRLDDLIRQKHGEEPDNALDRPVQTTGWKPRTRLPTCGRCGEGGHVAEQCNRDGYD